MRISIPFLAVLFVFCSFGLANAQTEFRKGYLVSFEGDTTRGLIQIQGPNKPYYDVVYREDFKSPKKVFTPYEAMGFGFDEGRYYETTIIKSLGWRPSFYEVIFDGDLKLIAYQKDLYLVDGPDYKLLQKTRKIMGFGDTGNGRQIYEHDEYKDVLYSSLEEWPQKIVQIDKTGLTSYNIASVLEEYHKVKDYDYKWYKESYPWTRFSLRALGVMNLSAAGVKSRAAFYNAGSTKTRQNLMPNFGLGFAGNLPEIGFRASFTIDFLYSQTDYEFNYNIQNSGERIRVDYEFEHEVLRVPMHIRYSLPGRLNNYPYVMAGFSFNFNSVGEGTRTMNYFYETTTIVDDPIPAEINKYNVRPSLGVGYNLHLQKRNNIIFEWRYEFGGHTVNYPYLSKDIFLKEYMNSFVVGFTF